MKCFVRGYNGLGKGSDFIRWFTFGKFSHVSMVFELPTGVSEEIESIQGSGVIIHEPWTHDQKDFVEMQAPLTTEQAVDARILFRSFEDALYDWRGIYGFMIRKKRHSADKWFCSEVVAYVLLKAGYPLSRREAYRETPTSVMESLRLTEFAHHSGGA